MATQTLSTTTVHAEPDRPLRRALQADAIVTAMSGVGLLLAAEPAARLLGMAASWPIALLGVDLILYAAWVGYEAWQAALRVRRARIMLALDIVWVLASVALILIDPFGFTAAGKWAIAAQADGVAVLGLLKYLGLRRLRGR